MLHGVQFGFSEMREFGNRLHDDVSVLLSVRNVHLEMVKMVSLMLQVFLP